jgi:hypothetical protein
MGVTPPGRGFLGNASLDPIGSTAAPVPFVHVLSCHFLATPYPFVLHAGGRRPAPHHLTWYLAGTTALTLRQLGRPSVTRGVTPLPRIVHGRRLEP